MSYTIHNLRQDVADALRDEPGGYNTTAITGELRDRYGLVPLLRMDREAFWDVVRRHHVPDPYATEEARRALENEFEDMPQVSVSVAPTVTINLTISLLPEEGALLETAANQAGQPLTDYVRRAALWAAQQEAKR